MADAITDARNILKSTKRDLLRRGNVVATGIGYKISGESQTAQPSLICSVSKKMPVASLPKRDVIPRSFDGIPTDVIPSGIIRAFSNVNYSRPVPGGVSVGHPEITAGTTGCYVKRDGQIYLLSNNHVIANTNDAQLGEPVIQPGPIDGGRVPSDQISSLADYVPINFPSGVAIPDPQDNQAFAMGANNSLCTIANGIAKLLNAGASLVGSQSRMQAISTRPIENLVDAALAGPIDPSLVDYNILGIGAIDGMREAELGMPVQKSGRTTGYTTGFIQQIDVTVSVQYDFGRVGVFEDQIIAGPMSQGGDSGAAVLDMEKNIVGLLFAGSDNVTLINRIQHVFGSLNISL